MVRRDWRLFSIPESANSTASSQGGAHFRLPVDLGRMGEGGEEEEEVDLDLPSHLSEEMSLSSTSPETRQILLSAVAGIRCQNKGYRPIQR